MKNQPKQPKSATDRGCMISWRSLIIILLVATSTFSQFFHFCPCIVSKRTEAKHCDTSSYTLNKVISKGTVHNSGTVIFVHLCCVIDRLTFSSMARGCWFESVSVRGPQWVCSMSTDAVQKLRRVCRRSTGWYGQNFGWEIHNTLDSSSSARRLTGLHPY